ncbi:MAG TPA: nucleotidyltransferase domain-containing protein [Thermoanaerobaculia bacterium]|nr:nucleotidyltransferase domain-containing protein [Thermoanaerobaculia bacterium]
MSTIGEVLLRPGDSVRFGDRDDLLERLDHLGQRIPARHEGRTREHREHFVMVRYLHFLARTGENFLPLPVTLAKPRQDPPDFVLEWLDGSQETFELTDGSTAEHQKKLSATSASRNNLILSAVNQAPERDAVQRWADILFAAFLKKAEGLLRGRFDLDHLLLYDLTGLRLLVPIELGGMLLKQKLGDWLGEKKPAHRFRRVSVLRDTALLVDVEGEQRILHGKSPLFRIPVLRSHGEEDLKRRLRNLDRFCRDHSIRHLKAFGSILGDVADPWADSDPDLPVFREDSDMDLLVEFEPGTRVTLFDMARMERELSELTGFKVDLRTAGDLSRYFRDEVLQEAAELRAS